MPNITGNPTAPTSSVAAYVQEKRTLITEIERDMAIFYRTFATDITEPLLESELWVAGYGLNSALETMRDPARFARRLDPELMQAISQRYQRFCEHAVAVMPLTATRQFEQGFDDQGDEYRIELLEFVPRVLWRAIADSVEMPATSEVCVRIHPCDRMWVEVTVPDLSLLELADLLRFKPAFEREWAAAKFYAQLTYNELFVEPG